MQRNPIIVQVANFDIALGNVIKLIAVFSATRFVTIGVEQWQF